MKVIERVFSYGTVYNTVQGGSKLNLWMKYQMKATEQYFSVVLFIMLYKVVLRYLVALTIVFKVVLLNPFDSLDRIL